MGLFGWLSGKKKQAPKTKYLLLKCPQCGLLSPDSVIKCDCGYVFPLIATEIYNTKEKCIEIIPNTP